MTKIRKNIRNTIIVVGLSLSILNTQAQVKELEAWLNHKNKKPLKVLAFSKQPLNIEQSKEITKLLVEHHQENMLKQYEKKWKKRKLSIGNDAMPFFYQRIGETPKDGRSLFISLHGGGSGPKSLNNKQYKNQQYLYNHTPEFKRLEGSIYLAPRSPYNTWDLWHKGNIDNFFNILIQLAVIKENVNPNKVYLLGYSAGGDGVYQVTPRTADRWAATAMMAGHPNETSPLGFRNTPFTLHMGALDNSYHRADVVKKWSKILDSLENQDPEGYKHYAHLHKGKYHWMDSEDAEALPWMLKYTRNPIPNKVIWIQDNVHHTTLYWLKVPRENIVTKGEIRVTYNKANNEIDILKNYSNTLILQINDQMLDLDKPITIKYQGKKIGTGKTLRTLLNIYNSLSKKGDSYLAFPASITVNENKEVLF